MSAAKVISQGVEQSIISVPGLNKLPTLLHLRAQITDGSGTAVVVADLDATTGFAGTTPGMTITRSAAGQYDVTFDPCRGIALGTVNINVIPNVVATVTEGRQVHIDKTAANTSAKLGKLRFDTLLTTGAGVATDPVSGSEIHLSFWADFG
jgi:hypothetical protein